MCTPAAYTFYYTAQQQYAMHVLETTAKTMCDDDVDCGMVINTHMSVTSSSSLTITTLHITTVDDHNQNKYYDKMYRMLFM